jgi:hypothetical protein
VRTLRIWTATWALGAALVGVALALGEPGHVPRPLLPPLLAAVGAAAGLAAGTLSRLLRRIAPGSRAAAAALAALCGLLAGLALWRFGLGTPPVASATAGVLLALVSWALETRAAGGAG